VQAVENWNSIHSGYATTTNRHGEVINVGESVIVYAGTTDSDVEYVVFIWKHGEEEIYRDGPIYDWEWDEWDGTSFRKFGGASVSEHILNGVDDWGIQVLFYGPTGHIRKESIISIKATSINVVPEVSTGTLTILLTILGSLAIFIRKKEDSL